MVDLKMENSQPKIEYNFPDMAYAPAPISARIPAVNENSVNNALALHMNSLHMNSLHMNSRHMNGVRYLGESTLPTATQVTTTEVTDKLAWMSSPAFRIAQIVSVAACAYHGYKRNNSVGWAIWWGICGGGVITPAIAIAQGFGKPRENLKKSK